MSALNVKVATTSKQPTARNKVVCTPTTTTSTNCHKSKLPYPRPILKEHFKSSCNTALKRMTSSSLITKRNHTRFNCKGYCPDIWIEGNIYLHTSDSRSSQCLSGVHPTDPSASMAGQSSTREGIDQSLHFYIFQAAHHHTITTAHTNQPNNTTNTTPKQLTPASHNTTQRQLTHHCRHPFAR